MLSPSTHGLSCHISDPGLAVSAPNHGEGLTWDMGPSGGGVKTRHPHRRPARLFYVPLRRLVTGDCRNMALTGANGR